MKFIFTFIIFAAISAQAEDRLSRLFYFPEAKQFYGNTYIDRSATKVDAISNSGNQQTNTKIFKLGQLVGYGINENLAVTLNVDYLFADDAILVQGPNVFKIDYKNEFKTADLSATYLFFKSAEGTIDRLGVEFTYGPELNGQHINDHYDLALRGTGSFAEFTSWLAQLKVTHNTESNSFMAVTSESALFQVQQYLSDNHFLRGDFQLDLLGDLETKAGQTQEYDPFYTLGLELGNQKNENFMILIAVKYRFGKSQVTAPVQADADISGLYINYSLNYKF